MFFTGTPKGVPLSFCAMKRTAESTSEGSNKRECFSNLFADLLPADIKNVIIQFANPWQSVPSFLAMRLVCREWNNLIKTETRKKHDKNKELLNCLPEGEKLWHDSCINGVDAAIDFCKALLKVDGFLGIIWTDYIDGHSLEIAYATGTEDTTFSIYHIGDAHCMGRQCHKMESKLQADLEKFTKTTPELLHQEPEWRNVTTPEFEALARILLENSPLSNLRINFGPLGDGIVRSNSFACRTLLENMTLGDRTSLTCEGLLFKGAGDITLEELGEEEENIFPLRHLAKPQGFDIDCNNLLKELRHIC